MSLVSGRRRGQLLIGVLLLACLAVLLLASGGTGEQRRLDPDSAAPEGTRALVEILRRQGVEVDVVPTVAAALRGASASGTLVVVDPERLADDRLEQLRRTSADVVLVEPQERSLDIVVPSLGLAGEATGFGGAAAGGCLLAEARRAGDIDAGGYLYSATGPGAANCYPQTGFPGDGAAVAQAESSGRTVVAIGRADILTNERLDERGNAAVALGLLGRQSRLTWLLPSAVDAPVGGDQQLSALLPAGLPYATVMAVLAVLVLALWRGRRLGPVVPEPLPVLVRATETTEGRARLYRRAGARDRAAAHLREATLRRLRTGSRLGRQAPPQAVVEAAAGRAGRHPADVAALLLGPPPGDDHELVGLADRLDLLEREARRQ